MHVSMYRNTKTHNIDLSTTNDNISNNQVDLGHNSVLNSTILSFLNLKPELDLDADNELAGLKKLPVRT